MKTLKVGHDSKLKELLKSLDCDTDEVIVVVEDGNKDEEEAVELLKKFFELDSDDSNDSDVLNGINMIPTDLNDRREQFKEETRRMFDMVLDIDEDQMDELVNNCVDEFIKVNQTFADKFRDQKHKLTISKYEWYGVICALEFTKEVMVEHLEDFSDFIPDNDPEKLKALLTKLQNKICKKCFGRVYAPDVVETIKNYELTDKNISIKFTGTNINLIENVLQHMAEMEEIVMADLNKLHDDGLWIARTLLSDIEEQTPYNTIFRKMVTQTSRQFTNGFEKYIAKIGDNTKTKAMLDELL